MGEFWKERTSRTLAPLTDEAVLDAERVLGVSLPSALLDLLRVQNGGSVARGAFPTSTRTSWAPDHVPFGDLMGIGPPGPRVSTILDTPYLVQEWELPESVVLLTGDGHWWIALDYRVCGPTGTPSVVWLDVEVDEDLTLATDFATFVAGLVPEDQFD